MIKGCIFGTWSLRSSLTAEAAIFSLTRCIGEQLKRRRGQTQRVKLDLLNVGNCTPGNKKILMEFRLAELDRREEIYRGGPWRGQLGMLDWSGRRTDEEG
jgi:hypothetical protein